MKLRIGSKNPVKVEAVQECFPDFEIVAFAADSCVQEQPLSLEEMIKGSRNRAKGMRLFVSGQSVTRESLEPVNPDDWGIGIESGVMHVDRTGKHAAEGWVNTIACSIWNGEKFSLGLAGGFVVPPAIMKIVMEEGVDLSEAALKTGLTIQKRVGYGEGIVNILTDGKMSRKPYIKQAIEMAMIQVNHPGLY